MSGEKDGVRDLHFTTPQPSRCDMNTGTTRIRHATPSDAAAIADIYAYYVYNSPVTFEVDPPTAAEMSRRMARSIVWLVCETTQDHELVGYCYAGRYRPEWPPYDVTVEVSTYLRHDNGWIHTGVGHELVMAVLSAVRAIRLEGPPEVQRYRRAIAIRAKPHDTAVDPPPKGFCDTLGFVYVGSFRKVGYKLGKWADVHFYQMDLDVSSKL